MAKRTGYTIAAVLCMALCLRAPFTGVGALASELAQTFSLSSSALGLLTTLPLLAFALFSAVVGACERRLGAGNAMRCAFIILATGIIVRSAAGVYGLFVGAAVIGAGIAIANVLAPVFVKQFFPEKLYLMTSLYLGVMTLGAGISNALAVPLAELFAPHGWVFSLGIWLIVPVCALLLWWPFRALRFDKMHVSSQGATPCAQSQMYLAPDVQKLSSPAATDTFSRLNNRALVRSPLAWCISLYMGIQSLLYYSLVAWFPSILEAQGFSSELAGYVSAIYVALGLLGSLLLPACVRRIENQSVIGAGLGLMYTLGMIALQCIELPFALVVVIICCGLCQGACISFATAQFAAHTRSTQDASALSGFAQSIGYAIAALGPVLLGVLLQTTGSWALPTLALLAGAVILVFLGWMVGHRRFVR